MQKFRKNNRPLQIKNRLTGTEVKIRNETKVPLNNNNNNIDLYLISKGSVSLKFYRSEVALLRPLHLSKGILRNLLLQTPIKEIKKIKWQKIIKHHFQNPHNLLPT